MYMLKKKTKKDFALCWMPSLYLEPKIQKQFNDDF